MTTAEKIALSVLLPELGTLTDDPLPTNRKVWTLIVGGVLPAEQINGRWFIRRADTPVILEKLGLRPRAATATEVAKRSVPAAA